MARKVKSAANMLARLRAQLPELSLGRNLDLGRTKPVWRPVNSAPRAQQTLPLLTPTEETLSDILSQLSEIEASLPSAVRLGEQPTVRAARRLNRASGMLALSVLLDSAIEHYRGSFKNRAMYTPLVVSSLALAVSAHGTGDRRPDAHILRDIVYSLAALTGVIGGGFHVYNVTKRPGGLSWQNLFYGAPIGAPIAILLSGLLGYYSERMRENEAGPTPRVFGFPAGRALAALTGAGLFGTTGEAGLLHFRGAYHNLFMFLPVTVPPFAGALMAETAFGPQGRNRWFTRLWLRLTALLGFIGAGFHAYGIQRNMGGWRNWQQNVLNGPPLPAPPSFTGLALAGLAALGLLKDHPDA